MHYTSTQAAQFLGISTHALKKLVVAGTLKDHGVTKEGASKHEIRLNLSELKKFKKENPTRKPTTSKAVRPTSITNFPGAGIMSRLDRIESKLDDLLKLWS